MVNKNLKIFGVSFLVLVIFVFLILSFSSVPNGYVGIKTQFGAVTGRFLSPGLQFKIPFVQQIQIIDCKTQRVDAEANAASKDLQTITSKIAVNYSVNPAKAIDLYKEVGLNFQSVVIDPAIQEVSKMVTAQYTAEELITKRGEVSIKMTKLLGDKITSKGIRVTDFNVINFDFSPEFNKAIESKQVAQQQALKAQQDLERIKIEAEQKIVQAKAEAESLKAQRQEITPELLELRKVEAQIQAIQKWDGKLPQYNGSNALPFIDITK